MFSAYHGLASEARSNVTSTSTVGSQSCFDGVKKGVVVKRFQQAIDSAVCQHPLSQCLRLMRGHKDNGYGMAGGFQLSLQIRPTHPIQPDVGDPTARSI